MEEVNSHISTNYEKEKPMRDTQGLIQHLKDKGVRFEYGGEESAISFLNESNNYFKLTAYRKNFDVYQTGPKQGQYINLDFEALRELSVLDMRLRYILVHMCLDIEHSIKVDLIRTVEKHDMTDAYAVVTRFISEQQKWFYSDPSGDEYIKRIESEAEKDEYRTDLVNKYKGNWPIWAFSEIVHFSDLIQLFIFVKCQYICKACSERDQKVRLTCQRIQKGEISSYYAYRVAPISTDIELCPRLKKMEHLDRLLQDVRHLRNAAAHNSCILNSLRIPAGSGNSDFPSPIVQKYLDDAMDELQAQIPGISKKSVNRSLKNLRIRQLFSVMCAHKYLVNSRQIKEQRWRELTSFADQRLGKRNELFTGCNHLVKSLELIKTTIDIWAGF